MQALLLAVGVGTNSSIPFAATLNCKASAFYLYNFTEM